MPVKQANLPEPLLPGGERYAPPDEFDGREAALWKQFMDAMPAGWFGRETLPLLEMLCQHIVISKELAVRVRATDPSRVQEIKGLALWLERETKIAANLAYQLRLTPKSRGEYQRKDERGTSVRRRPWEKDAA
jgi:hypothetical protein